MGRLRVGLVTTCIDNRTARGTALVARRFLEGLGAHVNAFEFTLIHATRTHDALYQSYEELVYPSIHFPIAKTMLNEAWFWIRHWLTRPKFDIVHYLQPRVWPSYLLTHAKKIIVTPHDAGIMLNLHPMGMGEYLFQGTNRFLHQRMHRLIAVSEFSRREIASSFHVPLDRVVAVTNGVDASFQPVQDREAARKLLQEKYHFPERYLLSVGRFDPHKNILRLIDAYHRLHELGRKEHLVLVGGRHSPDYSRQVEEKIRTYHLEDHIHLSPYIEEPDMPLVYGMAECLIYPSLHEGSGLPIIEAMRCGTPVATSCTTALPETAGGAALLFDPENVNELVEAMHTLLTKQPIREQLIANGFKRATHFTWEGLVKTILEIYYFLARTQ